MTGHNKGSAIPADPSLDELLPTSKAYGKGHDSLFGLVAGMLVMALSLLMLK